MVEDYNKNKAGVDLFDRKAQQYTTSRATRRWTNAIHTHIVDSAIINAHIIYCEFYDLSMNVYSRKQFMRDLALEMALEHTKERIKNMHQKIPAEVREKVQKVIDAANCLLTNSSPHSTINNPQNMSSSSSNTPETSSSNVVVASGQKRKKRCGDCSSKKKSQTIYQF